MIYFLKHNQTNQNILHIRYEIRIGNKLTNPPNRIEKKTTTKPNAFFPNSKWFKIFLSSLAKNILLTHFIMNVWFIISSVPLPQTTNKE